MLCHAMAMVTWLCMLDGFLCLLLYMFNMLVSDASSVLSIKTCRISSCKYLHEGADIFVRSSSHSVIATCFTVFGIYSEFMYRLCNIGKLEPMCLRWMVNFCWVGFLCAFPYMFAVVLHTNDIMWSNGCRCDIRKATKYQKNELHVKYESCRSFLFWWNEFYPLLDLMMSLSF